MASDLRFCGANERIRTADLRITSALLYQLSHVGKTLLTKRLSSIANRACLRKRSGWIISLRLLAVPYGEKPLGDEVFQVRDYREESRVRRCAAGTARRGAGRGATCSAEAPGAGAQRYGGCREAVGAARALRYTGRHWKSGGHGLKTGGPFRPGAALRSAVSPEDNEVHL